jgi:hypothetical protein
VGVTLCFKQTKSQRYCENSFFVTNPQPTDLVQ